MESIVIFQNTKCTFYLNGSVYPIFDPCFTQDVFIRFLPLFQKLFDRYSRLFPLANPVRKRAMVL